jgi:hypothetical protein
VGSRGALVSCCRASVRSPDPVHVVEDTPTIESR